LILNLLYPISKEALLKVSFMKSLNEQRINQNLFSAKKRREGKRREYWGRGFVKRLERHYIMKPTKHCFKRRGEGMRLKGIQ
jgi:hypothetical protein